MMKPLKYYNAYLISTNNDKYIHYFYI